ncbi:MAG: mannose-6-phosphate isomerase, class I [Bdellovibrio sp.]
MAQLIEFTKLLPSASFKIWGGSELSKLKGIAVQGEPLGETWEVSIHPDGPSLIGGESLAKVLNPQQLPYLIKFIDTSDNLSIQVHPDDEYAQRVEKQAGKTECWVILGAGEGAGLYLGLKEGVTKEEFQTAVESSKDVQQLMNFYPVSRGDFFYVPAGSLHAIGKNVLMCEIQQSSGVTYRVWDWNRVDSKGRPRELHLNKAMDVAIFSPEKNIKSYFKAKSDVLNQKGLNDLVSHNDFNVQVWKASNKDKVFLETKDRVLSVVCLEGKFRIQQEVLNSFEAGITTTSQEIHCLEDGVCLVVT